MNKIKNIFITMLMGSLFITLLSLGGCATKKDVSVYLQEPNVTTGPTREQLIQLLQGVGVPILQKRNEMVIVLSNQKLFQQESTELKPGNPRLLQVVALLMKKDQKELVTITGYSNQSQLPLAKQQIRYLAQLLWQYNIDARIMKTNNFTNQQLPWECGRINQCTLIRYRYFPQIPSYN